MKKIKRDDEVIVTTGKDKGKRGKVLKVQADGKVIVSGINMIKKHQKAKDATQSGQIIEREAGIDCSNVMIVCPECTETVRIGTKVLEDGTKTRMCKGCKATIETLKK